MTPNTWIEKITVFSVNPYAASRKGIARMAADIIQLRERMVAMMRCAQYVCAHEFDSDTAVGTRMVAVEDLRSETSRCVDVLEKMEGA